MSDNTPCRRPLCKRYRSRLPGKKVRILRRHPLVETPDGIVVVPPQRKGGKKGREGEKGRERKTTAISLSSTLCSPPWAEGRGEGKRERKKRTDSFFLSLPPSCLPVLSAGVVKGKKRGKEKGEKVFFSWAFQARGVSREGKKRGGERSSSLFLPLLLLFFHFICVLAAGRKKGGERGKGGGENRARPSSVEEKKGKQWHASSLRCGDFLPSSISYFLSFITTFLLNSSVTHTADRREKKEKEKKRKRRRGKRRGTRAFSCLLGANEKKGEKKKGKKGGGGKEKGKAFQNKRPPFNVSHGERKGGGEKE